MKKGDIVETYKQHLNDMKKAIIALTNIRDSLIKMSEIFEKYKEERKGHIEKEKL